MCVCVCVKFQLTGVILEGGLLVLFTVTKTCRRVAYWFLSFRLTKPVSHPPSRGGGSPLCRWASLDCKKCVKFQLILQRLLVGLPLIFLWRANQCRSPWERRTRFMYLCGIWCPVVLCLHSRTSDSPTRIP